MPSSYQCVKVIQVSLPRLDKYREYQSLNVYLKSAGKAEIT